MTVKSILTAAVLATLAAAPASAALVPILGYDMNNGDGQASSFYANYWDGSYGGPGASGNPTVDNSYLSGGKGILADGIIPKLRWDNFAVTPYPGPGKYVGWYTPTYGDPLIIFHLNGNPTVTSVTLYVDASNNGNVGAPSGVRVDGHLYAPTTGWTVDPHCADSWTTGANALTCYQKLTITGSWVGNLITVQPVHGAQPWIFLSEVQFGTSAVPELSTWIMMLIGFAGLGFLGYRRKVSRSVAVA